ncbi:MAG: Smr/MutS family protein [Deltaproteobacteria bacterium]|nr:Smr/MutS family protein [Deltaproteobacteria bacterium]
MPEDYQDQDNEITDYVHHPVDGILDLHTFSPRDAGSVVKEYIRVCHEQGLPEVRIIHGKGKGILRQTVHSILEKHPLVSSYRLDSGLSSGWGATIASLKRV